jgi:hypothetical protein
MRDDPKMGLNMKICALNATCSVIKRPMRKSILEVHINDARAFCKIFRLYTLTKRKRGGTRPKTLFPTRNSHCFPTGFGLNDRGPREGIIHSSLEVSLAGTITAHAPECSLWLSLRQLLNRLSRRHWRLLPHLRLSKLRLYLSTCYLRWIK